MEFVFKKICGFCALMVLAVRTKARGDSKIYGGHKIDLKQVPHIVSLQDDGMHFCGGSLLTLTHILTACHCLGETCYGMIEEEIRLKVFKKLTVVAGTEDIAKRSKLAQERRVVKQMLHPKCTYENIMSYDFALGIVDKPFIESVKVKTLTLSLDKTAFEKETASLLEGKKKCIVAGWGTTETHPEEASDVLLAVEMRVIPDTQCGELLSNQNPKFRGFDFKGNAQLCTLAWGMNNASECTGDSGGPLTCDSQVYGTVSYGYDCGRFDEPNVDAKLADAVEWIRELGIPGIRPPRQKKDDSSPKQKKRGGRRTISGQDSLGRLSLLQLLIFGLAVAMNNQT